MGNPKITIIAKKKHATPRTLLELHHVLGTSIQEIDTRLVQGTPLVELAPFYNNHSEVASLLEKVTNILSHLDVPFTIYELDEQEQWEDTDAQRQQAMPLETMRTMLNRNAYT